MHFDCNFGAMHVPIAQKAGAEENKSEGFQVHEQSTSGKVE